MCLCVCVCELGLAHDGWSKCVSATARWWLALIKILFFLSGFANPKHHSSALTKHHFPLAKINFNKAGSARSESKASRFLVVFEMSNPIWLSTRPHSSLCFQTSRLDMLWRLPSVLKPVGRRARQKFHIIRASGGAFFWIRCPLIKGPFWLSQDCLVACFIIPVAREYHCIRGVYIYISVCVCVCVALVRGLDAT